ncbi:MAG TPA: methylmalonyl-CoA mutase family protein [Pseudogracilibacillus sp.]|nr:methylmalonyl-CoA mutase family protein [Pseudogracilibacillus sp.]
MIDKMKQVTFDKVDDALWKEVAIKSLRGQPFEKLISKTSEGIEIHPLYTKELLEKTLGDKVEKITNTVRQTKKTDTWIIAQATYSESSEMFMADLTDSLERGNEAIVYDGKNNISWTTESLSQLAELMLIYPVYAFDLKAEDEFVNVFEMIDESERKKVQGVVTGNNIKLSKDYQKMRTLSLDAREVHLNGSDIITELAIILAQAAEAAENFTNFQNFEDQIIVRFAIDTEFFLEISKIRAFRVLWQTFAENYGYKGYSSVPIHSETSLRSYSKLDEYVNLLRAGNESLAAVIGGTDILTVHPHNILTGSNALSRRYARNVQLVLKEETYVDDVIDHSGGSYFVETLTNEYIEAAWDYFLEIEELGGYSAFINSGELEKRVKKTREKRFSDIAHNKKSLIGTNVYADLSAPIIKGDNPLEIAHRLAEPYEKLRAYFEEKQPKIVLLTFGELKDFKPRADFVKGFLATGGLDVEFSPAFKTVKEGQEWIKTTEFDYGVICVSPKETEEVVNELVEDLPKGKTIDIAGKYTGEEASNWKNAGIADFIYKGQNQIAKLNEIKQKWEEVVKHG